MKKRLFEYVKCLISKEKHKIAPPLRRVKVVSKEFQSLCKVLKLVNYPLIFQLEGILFIKVQQFTCNYSERVVKLGLAKGN